MRKLALVLATCALVACSDNDNDDFVAAPADPSAPEAPAEPETPAEPEITPAQFEVTTTNLTVAQPLSPIAVLVHAESARVFSVGSAASNGLEVLAEGGDNSALLDEIDSVAEVSGAGPVGPGASETLMVELPDDDTAGLSISMVTMLVNTNDAFTAVNGAGIADLEVGEYLSFNTPSYDSGTESNSEAAADIPGPAGGGEGFNEARDDIRDQVTMHSGVVTADDGLAGSALNQSHRWDNPTARVRITRVQ